MSPVQALAARRASNRLAQRWWRQRLRDAELADSGQATDELLPEEPACAKAAPHMHGFKQIGYGNSLSKLTASTQENTKPRCWSTFSGLIYHILGFGHAKIEATLEHVHVSLHNEPIGPDKELNDVTTELFAHKTSGKDATGSKGVRSRINSAKISKADVALELVHAVTETAGVKAAYSAKLAALAEQAPRVFSDQGVPVAFKVPKGKVIPFGCMEEALSSSGKLRQLEELLDYVETVQLEGGELDTVCNALRELVSEQRQPASMICNIAKGFTLNARFIVRSSTNVEDLAGMSGAGLYGSIANVMAAEEETFGQAVAGVWSSLYTRRAVLSRRVAGVKQNDAAMAVLVQELLTPELSFVLHTVSPIDRNAKVVQAKLAVGLGETLASGTKGTPWRLECNKFDRSVKILAFSNFSHKMYLQHGNVANRKIVFRVVDYSKNPFSVDADHFKHIGQRLATIGFFLEQKFGTAQDIERCVVGDDIYIAQA